MKKPFTRREFIKAGAVFIIGVTSLGAGDLRCVPLLSREAFGQEVPSGGSRPNLLFVMADQWRRQAMGFMNEDPVITPNLDRFAKESVVFERAVCCTPLCSPGRACLLTGRYPIHHGVIGNDIALPATEIGYADVLKKAGYQTGYIGKWHLSAEAGPPPQNAPPEGRFGFDYWVMSLSHRHFSGLYYVQDAKKLKTVNRWMPDHETDLAVEFIKHRRKDAPFALTVSFAPPHPGGGPGFAKEKSFPAGKEYGYAAPEQYEALYQGKPLKRRPNVPDDYAAICLPGYWGACSAIDAAFGRLLTCLDEEGITGDTVVLFTADHGEMLGSQRLMGKRSWFEESIGVPFLIRYPRKLKPQRVREVFNSIDVMPSILGLMGSPVPSAVDGQDYSALMRGQPQKVPRSAFLSFFKGAPSEEDRHWRAVYTGKYTYAVCDKASRRSPMGRDGLVLYDNENDPYQMKPILRGDGQDDVIDALHRALADHLDRLGDTFLKERWAGRRTSTAAPQSGSGLKGVLPNGAKLESKGHFICFPS